MQMKSSSTGSGANGQGIVAAITGPYGALSREFHNILVDIEDLIKATTSLTGDDLVRAKAKVVERVAAAKVSVEQMGGMVVDRARDAAKVTDRYVHEQPWQAIGIGAGVGLLLGVVIARRT